MDEPIKTPEDIANTAAFSAALDKARMTAPAQMPSEPEFRVANLSETLRVESALEMFTKKQPQLMRDAADQLESLQAEVERLREKYDAVSVVALNHLRRAEAEKSRANVCKKDAEINAERAESAERKLAEAVAALRKFSEHCPHCKAVVDEATK